MKRVFIDTNLLYDFLYTRTPHYAYIEQLFELGRQKKVQLVLSCLSIASAQCSLKKVLSVAKIRAWLADICSLCELAAVTDRVVMGALAALKFEDLEAAMQYVSAVESGADAIVTRNEKDFKSSQLPVMNAQEFLLAYLENNQ
jgi:predicted nucleic acid-binding protein